MTLRLQMDVAAFVDASDTMFLESASSLAGPWMQRAWWNAGKDARWADTTKGDDAWRREVVDFGGYEGDTIYTRLRFRSNASRQSDGFYIDDITWGVVSSVPESDQAYTVSIAPNPADAHINLTMSTDQPVHNLMMYDASGRLHSIVYKQNGHNVTIESQALATGFYVISGSVEGELLYAPVMIRH
jgi:hypothetical protein